METGKSYLFVYGTLRRGLSSPVLEFISSDIEWKGEAVICGRLYDIGDYPGAVPSTNQSSVIKGELVEIVSPRKVWKILDRYEGSDQANTAEAEYLRKKEQVRLTGGKVVEAWVYWYNLSVKNKRRIRNQDYLKYLRKKQLA